MERILLPLLLSSMLAATAYGQSTSLSMNLDGSGRIMVEESGDAPPKNFRLSPQALEFTFQTLFDELLENEIRGISRNTFKQNPVEAAVTQTMLGMTSEQAFLLAKKQYELFENTKDKSYDFLDQLTRFDDLSPEEKLDFGENFSKSLREQFENEDKMLAEVLTPVQLQQLAELEFVSNGGPIQDFPVLNPKAYASVGLSEEQQKELANILRESKTELKEITLSLIYGVKEMAKEVLASYVTSDEEDISMVMAKLYETLSEEEMEKLQEKFESFAIKTFQKQVESMERIGTKIGTVFTPQQREKLAQLKEELSEKSERIRNEQLAKLEGKKPEEEKKPEDYEFLKSWRPGDPIPEGTIPPPPPKRFPRGL